MDRARLNAGEIHIQIGNIIHHIRVKLSRQNMRQTTARILYTRIVVFVVVVVVVVVVNVITTIFFVVSSCY